VLPDKVPYYILDVLQQVPSVYVKDLGRFEAIFHSAVIDSSTDQIKPPFLEPEFKEGVDSTQEILADYMRYVSGVDLEAAEEAIKDFVKEVKRNTEDGLKFPVEKFGTFFRTASGNISFTPDWDAFNLAFSGLEILPLKAPVTVYKEVAVAPAILPFTEPEIVSPVSTEIKSNGYEQPEGITTDKKQEYQAPGDGQIDESTSRLWWIILTTALILITVLCAYLAWDILSNRNKLNELKQVHQDSTISKALNDINSRLDSTNIDVQNIPVEENLVEDQKEEEIPVTSKPVPQPLLPKEGESSCFVVVGAFTNPENVIKMVKRIEAMGYTSEQIKGGSMTRVAIRTSCDQATLQKTLDAARSSINPESWIK
jgi:hypothetical protein